MESPLSIVGDAPSCIPQLSQHAVDMKHPRLLSVTQSSGAAISVDVRKVTTARQVSESQSDGEGGMHRRKGPEFVTRVTAIR